LKTFINSFVIRKNFMSTVIEVRNLTKEFREVIAVKDLSFTVSRGEIYGFLGQNGAGKSTTIRMLLSLITPSQGTITIFGKNLRQHRKFILKQTGAIIEKPDLYKYLSALENLRIFSLMSGVKLSHREMMKQLELVGLASRAHSKVKTYSQGMKQRLGIAIALAHDPELIILDEPMNGLDPQGIADMRQLIRHLSRDLGKTVFISSHLLTEIELIADSMLIIDRGKKVVEGKVNDLLNPAESDVEIESPLPEIMMEKIQNTPWNQYRKSVSGKKIILNMPKDRVPEMIRDLIEAGVSIQSVKPRHSLEDYFLSLTAN
jgi:ABC-type multidrug transport system ATPase subunit